MHIPVIYYFIFLHSDFRTYVITIGKQDEHTSYEITL